MMHRNIIWRGSLSGATDENAGQSCICGRGKSITEPAAIDGETNSQHLSAETTSRLLHPRACVHSSRSQTANLGAPVQWAGAG